MAELTDTLKQALTLGRLCYQKKDYAGAERYLGQFVEHNQSFADVYNMLGVVYHDQGQFQRAQRAFEAALRINPRYTDAALSLAVIYNDTGKYQDARDIYRLALSSAANEPGELDRFVKGKLANVYADAGDVWLCAGRYHEAIGDYQRALDLCPGFVDIRARLAAALRDSGDRDQAISEYQRIVRDAPGYLAARLALGVSLHAAGRREEAIEQWEAVLELSPGNGSAEMYLEVARAEVAGERAER